MSQAFTETKESLEGFIEQVRAQFPTLLQEFNGKEIVFLDNTNTTMKPQSVIDRVTQFYTFENSNVHRGAYRLSQNATENFEATRAKVANFLSAKTPDEIVFVRGTTEAINLVAATWGEKNIRDGDEILLTELEHHSNIVPWQMLAERKNAIIKVARIHDNGELDLQDFERKLSAKTKLVAVTACSNTLGTFTPIKQLAAMAHKVGAKILIDGAQIVTQKKVNVVDVDADFFAFSAHKIFGPTGVGVLYGKKEILEGMPPYQGGGSMISRVTFAKTTYNDVPTRFEAGTPHVEGVVALKTALDFVEGIGYERISQWEHHLLVTATQRLEKIQGLTIYGNVSDKAPILSFNLDRAHSSDVAQIMDQCGVCVRAGHHCTQPLMDRLGISSSVRASFSVYNNYNDILALEKSILKAKELLL
ncbi:MAG: SufS family cysteine desulfurase [Bdellovibrionaceae bacterium]|nr:SufS family cysteine desulfurase [Pseudobdellovibrionaceae bacterium]